MKTKSKAAELLESPTEICPLCRGTGRVELGGIATKRRIEECEFCDGSGAIERPVFAPSNRMRFLIRAGIDARMIYEDGTLGESMPIDAAHKILGVDPRAVPPGARCKTCGGTIVKAYNRGEHSDCYCTRKHISQFTKAEVKAGVSMPKKSARKPATSSTSR